MPRRRCCGCVDDFPISSEFEPVQTVETERMVLGLEEFEAIRLKDKEGYDQETCAKEMGLTRPTFQRILASAHKKVATALAEGRSIQIAGGNYKMKNRVFECLDCGHVWEEAPCTEGGKHGYEIACPKCGGMKKTKIVDGVKHACGGAEHHGEHEHGGCGCCGGH